MTTNIYVLEQASGKFYVGKAADVQKRYEEHVAGLGSAWTKKYKPIRILSVTENASSWDEDRIFKSMAATHGISNVRGAAYSNVILTEDQHHRIQTDIWAATDKCIRCGRGSHFVTKCYAKSDINGNPCASINPPVAPVNSPAAPVNPPANATFGQLVGEFISDLFEGLVEGLKKSD